MSNIIRNEEETLNHIEESTAQWIKRWLDVHNENVLLKAKLELVDSIITTEFDKRDHNLPKSEFEKGILHGISILKDRIVSV